MKKIKIEVELPDEIDSLLLGILKIIDESSESIANSDNSVMLLGKKIISDFGSKFDISVPKNENN